MQFKTLYVLSFLLLFCSSLSAQDYLKRANTFFEYAQYDSALYYYNKIKETPQNRVVKFKGIVNTLIKQGRLLEASKKIESEKGIAESDEAIEIQEIEAFLQLQKGDTELAITQYQKINAQLTNANYDSLKAKIYNGLGVAYWSLGQYQQALSYLEQALTLSLKLFGSAHPDVAGTYNNLGLVYSKKDTDRALEYYDLALASYEKAYPKNHPTIGNAFVNLGTFYIEKKAFLSADYNLRQALEIFEAVFGKRHQRYAFVLNNLAIAAREDGLFEEAITQHKQALSIYKKVFGNRHPETANTYYLIGVTYGEMTEYRLALEAFQQAFIANSISFSNTDIYSFPATEEYLNSITSLVTAVAKAKAFDALHFNKTLKFKHLKGALVSFSFADKLIDKIRTVRETEEDKLTLSAISTEVYERAIEICLTMAEVSLKPSFYEEKAFYFSEKNKSAVLLGAISDTKAKSFANIPASLLEKEKEIKSQITALQQELIQAETEANKTQLKEALFRESQTYQLFIKQLSEEYPDYHSLKYATQIATVQDIQNTLQENEALLSYAYSAEGNRLFIFHIEKYKFKSFNISISEGIKNEITLLRNTLLWQIDDVYADIAHQLYKQVIPNTISTKIEKLILIPDNILGTTPFEVFLTHKVKPDEDEAINWASLPYLMKKYATSYAYSATLFRESFSGNQNSKTDKEIFLCAPIHFRETLETNSKKRLNSLPATQTEVEKIQAIFSANGLTSDIYLENDAHEALIKSNELKQYKYLHFATHGVVNEEQPALSQLFLAPYKDNEHDGDLYAGEIYNLALNADLVTLSACQTGLGKVTKGEGIMGLSRALLYAGAKNLTVSLWSVADNSTAELMVDFYEELATNSTTSFAEALQSAKLQMLGNKPYAAPYYWAPFILIGK